MSQATPEQLESIFWETSKHWSSTPSGPAVPLEVLAPSSLREGLGLSLPQAVVVTAVPWWQQRWLGVPKYAWAGMAVAAVALYAYSGGRA